MCEQFRTSDKNYEHNINILSSKRYLTTQLVPDCDLDIEVWLQIVSNISSFDHQLRVKPGCDTFLKDKIGLGVNLTSNAHLVLNSPQSEPLPLESNQDAGK